MAARLTKNASEEGFKVNPKEPYAELWMGTHPTNPTSLRSSPDTLLSSHLTQHPELLGTSASKFRPPFDGAKGSGTEDQTTGHVPFLFKVLTCKQALPLQIHPNKDLAKKLHEEDPEKYPDVNHKPEIAVCLSGSFLGFASFRPYAQIVQFLTTIPEIKALSSSALQSSIETFISNPTGDTLRPVWEEFLKLSDNEDSVKAFTERVKKEREDAFEGLVGEGFSLKEKGNMVKAVVNSGHYYPGDGGLFSTLFFLNLVELKKGEGMYVGADGPHAWLDGEIVELMAISDNVLNVGFTPDSDKDDPSLVAKTVTCAPKTPSELILKSTEFSKSSTGKTTVYSTPFEEFSILRIEGDDSLKAFDGPGVAVITSGQWVISENDGEAKSVSASAEDTGSVWFIGAGTESKWERKSVEGEVWMAFYDADAKKDEVGKK
ncbi:mannose-6-phosphate isomerase, class I [Kwoniella heveanensis BCC8398]|uniref:Mannose-6-phosphate isomerase n=1 Tax=Kwoniella heveanensis BCC8398 TaxID=1296120 RepID=A0A1B9GS84_9TREE|nr:mannose-6-phosphate isomerase, class I [Kwoniella heveanensis BCC8398]